MEWPGFIGGSYTTNSSQYANDETYNFYAEVGESGTGKSKAVLYGTPGTLLFAALPAGPLLGVIEIGGTRGFVVAGSGFYEVFNDGSFVQRGAVDGIGPFSLATNAFQILLSNGPDAWVLNLGTNVFTHVSSFPGGKTVTYLDGYFVAAGSNGRQFNISALNDGLTWDPLDFALKEGAADDLLTAIAVRRQLWLLGSSTSEVWWNTGNNNFPFQPLQGVILQEGTGAPRSATLVGNGLYWLGRDSRGNGTVQAEQNYTPQRVSNFAQESQIDRYANIEDAIGTSYQEAGHEFLLLTFPNPQVTWALDVASGIWCKRGVWDGSQGLYKTAVCRYHMYVFGRHLVGGGDNTGNVYSQSLLYFTDNGTPIRRLRRAPHLHSLNRKITYSRIELEQERGVTRAPDGADADTNPKLMLRFSRNGGSTYSNERQMSAGKIGDYTRRSLSRRHGSARDFVLEIASTGSYRHAWMNLYVLEFPGTEPG